MSPPQSCAQVLEAIGGNPQSLFANEFETEALLSVNPCLVSESTAPLPYYSSATSNPKNLVISVHGYPHDANQAFVTAVAATQNGGCMADTLVVAPLFPVHEKNQQQCSTTGVPQSPTNADNAWSCSSWITGGNRSRQEPSSYAALDALLQQQLSANPSIQHVTLAGFSAGAQFMQRYVLYGNAQEITQNKVDFLLGSPGSFNYLDGRRLQAYLSSPPVSGGSSPAASSTFVEPSASYLKLVPNYNSGKYGFGTQSPTDIATMQNKYLSSQVSYVVGSLDNAPTSQAFYSILDKSASAEAQGPYRFERSQTFAKYAHTFPQCSSTNHQFTVAEGCSHDVACVFNDSSAVNFCKGFANDA